MDIKNHFGNKRYGWLTLFLSAFNNNTLNYWPKKECCVVVGWWKGMTYPVVVVVATLLQRRRKTIRRWGSFPCTEHKRNKKVTFKNKSREFSIRFSKKEMSKTRDQGELQNNNNNTHRWGRYSQHKSIFPLLLLPVVARKHNTRNKTNDDVGLHTGLAWKTHSTTISSSPTKHTKVWCKVHGTTAVALLKVRSSPAPAEAETGPAGHLKPFFF